MFGAFGAHWAIAHVARAARTPSVRDFRFGTSNRPPGPAAPRAAASATDGVPVAAATPADGCGTSIRASSAAANARTGSPRRAAAPTTPGSSAFEATVASAASRCAVSPADRRHSSTRPATSSTDTPRPAPTPATRSRAAGAVSCTGRRPSDSKAPWPYSSRSARS